MTKVLFTFSGKEYVLDDNEAQNIVKLKQTEKKAFIKLRCGAYVDTSAIESITEPPLMPVSAEGYPLSKDGRSFIRDGMRIWVEHPEGIHYIEDPKYENLAEAQFEITEAKKDQLPENPQEDGLREGKMKRIGEITPPNKK